MRRGCFSFSMCVCTHVHIHSFKPVVVFGKGIDQCWRHSQGLAHVADGAARAPAHDGSSQGSSVASILGVDVLDHFFTPLMLEVHINIWRLAAPVNADEALQQRLGVHRVHGGDAQAVADH